MGQKRKKWTGQDQNWQNGYPDVSFLVCIMTQLNQKDYSRWTYFSQLDITWALRYQLSQVRDPRVDLVTSPSLNCNNETSCIYTTWIMYGVLCQQKYGYLITKTLSTLVLCYMSVVLFQLSQTSSCLFSCNYNELMPRHTKQQHCNDSNSRQKHTAWCGHKKPCMEMISPECMIFSL